MDLNLKNKVALVVASSQGLGKAIATQLLKEGASVMITSRDADKLKMVQEELGELGVGQVSYFPADIRRLEDIQKLVQQTRDTYGKIDILINNTGGPPGGTFDELTDEQWLQAFELNLLSYIRLIREVLPYLKQEGGRIINIASSSIKEPIPGLTLSNTLRPGIVGLTKSLAEELAPYNILIHTVAPGRINTDRVVQIDEMSAKKAGLTYEAMVKQARNQIPLGRYGEPEELAKVVTFLVSDACTYMTGGSFLIDGGKVKSI
ncbi:SDR family oxidoreductase [Ammoniphilus sp. YIM 78166]|uniref:SDR family oxidoreductase n=1 Tax=Ammoniphilus sp. YIM 78166 TaxID=1644106 RepID=UPI00106F122E|nr:SDR family oxidoreductase [Ammoniphilus sp. YIM 78166]